jgi:site-specific recombinase XerD
MGVRSRELLRRERMETTLPKLVEMFVATKRAEGKTAKTVKWYREMLGRFVAYAGPETTIKELSVDLAREFVASLQNQEGRWINNHYRPTAKGKLSSMTIHAYVRALRSFSSWMVEDGFTRYDVSANLKRPRTERKLISNVAHTHWARRRTLAFTCKRSESSARLRSPLLMAFIPDGEARMGVWESRCCRRNREKGYHLQRTSACTRSHRRTPHCTR